MRKESIYIVRLWSDSPRDDIWRASLENLMSKEKQAFASLEDLLDFLKLQPDLLNRCSEN